MGSSISTSSTTISSLPLTMFEYLNELYIAVGAGFWGMAVLLNHGIRNQKYGGTLCLTGITAFCLLYLFNSDEFNQVNKKKIVVITGCDSGLGFSLALHLHEIGLRVLAGCLDMNSDGARQLEASGVRKFELNVTNVESVKRGVKFVSKIVDEDPANDLWAVINNAGIMVFAEFEWQTDKLMFEQINVNLIGAMRVTKGFAPLLRQHRARLINISSHCALESLPGLGVYGASKAGIKGFTDALRVEFRKYGVKVITFIPGSFPTQSNILAKQMNYVYEMRSSFTKEQEDFYGEYFQRYNAYLSAIATPNPARKLRNPDLYDKFEHALLAKYPKCSYKVEPMRYWIYHTLFKYSPIRLRDYFVEMFVRMPVYESRRASKTSSKVQEIDTPQRLGDEEKFKYSYEEWTKQSPGRKYYNTSPVAADREAAATSYDIGGGGQYIGHADKDPGIKETHFNDQFSSSSQDMEKPSVQSYDENRGSTHWNDKSVKVMSDRSYADRAQSSGIIYPSSTKADKFSNRHFDDWNYDVSVKEVSSAPTPNHQVKDLVKLSGNENIDGKEINKGLSGPGVSKSSQLPQTRSQRVP